MKLIARGWEEEYCLLATCMRLPAHGASLCAHVSILLGEMWAAASAVCPCLVTACNFCYDNQSSNCMLLLKGNYYIFTL